MLAELLNSPKVVGAKQVKRAIELGAAGKVYLAEDADPRVTQPVAALSRERGIPLQTVPSMKELGRVCGIAVGAAVAALMKG